MSASSLQDAYLTDGMIIFGGPYRGGFASKGFTLELPSLSNASPAYLNQLEIELRSMLRWPGAGTRLQFSWSTDADFRDPLLEFHDRTEAGVIDGWSQSMRNERFIRYHGRMVEGRLRRDRLRVFITRGFDAKPTPKEAEIRQRLSEAGQGFEMFAGVMEEFAKNLGGAARSLDQSELAEDFFRFLNPLQGSAISFDPECSILQNFQLGDGVGFEKPCVGFYLNGAYHGIVALGSLPQATCSGIIQHLSGIPVCNLAICVNITPLETRNEIAREEAEIAKLNRALATTRQQRMESARATRQERIARLIGGAAVPFHCQLIVRVWDATSEGLQSKLATVKSAMLRMKSARPYEVAFPTSAMALYRCCTPGWSFDAYRDFEHYVEDAVLANLVPATGSSGNGLQSAEALYDDGNGGLLGISGFSSENGGSAPKHMLVSGKTGSGKSLFVNDLLVQTAPHYDFTVIIDDGFSYGGTVLAMGGQSFVLEPNSGHTFNYLDPRDALTAEHLADACAILVAMWGSSRPSSELSAIVAGGLKRFYVDAADSWLADSGENLHAACCEAIAFQKFVEKSKGTPRRTAGTWSEYRALKLQAPLEYQKRLAEITTDEILAFRSQEVAEDILRRLCFATMPREAMPIHSQFVHWLQVEALAGSPEAKELGNLSVAVRRWCKDGEFGGLFDGVGNFDFSGNLVHLELGKISEGMKDLRSVALLLICNQVKNEMMRRPRSQRKRIVFEEMSALLDVPDAERVIRGFFERGRRDSVWILAIIQQIGERTGSPAFVSIVGNTRQCVFFKQTSADEANAIAEAFRLPESGRETLLSLPDPSADRGAAFLLCTYENGRPVVKLGSNVVHPQMLFVAGSSGEQHEAREAALSSGGGILAAAAAIGGV